MSEQEKTKDRLSDICREAQDAAAEMETVFGQIFDQCDIIQAQCHDNAAVKTAVSAIYETGSFQDVMRQRMEKIMRIIARIHDPSLPEDTPLLGGPRHSGDAQGLKQDDVNRLLNDSD